MSPRPIAPQLAPREEHEGGQEQEMHGAGAGPSHQQEDEPRREAGGGEEEASHGWARR